MQNDIRIIFFTILFIGATAPPIIAGNNTKQAFSTWPDTGQTKCYDSLVEIPCPVAGEDYYGQDAQYHGPTRSYTLLGGGTVVQDNVTGLTWEMKGNMDDIINYNNLHDSDNFYTWCDPVTNLGLCDGYNNTKDFIAQLNSANFNGYNDWRLPTIEELSTLIDFSRYAPAIDPVFTATFYNSEYLASTKGVTYPHTDVDFYRGESWSGSTSYSSRVRAVRGGQTPLTENRFIDNGETVTDTVTGLEWQKTNMVSMNWKNALAAAENLTLAGQTDWRLPDQNELRSLVDYSRYYPTIDPVFAATTQTNFSYWSSTTDVFNLGNAWLVNFANSDVHSAPKGNGCYVRCVRGGQPKSFGNLVISRSGTGTVTSIPSGIDCGHDCIVSYAVGTTIKLTATPAAGNIFIGWSGGNCTGTGECTVNIDSDKKIFVDFKSIADIKSKFPWTMFLPVITKAIK